MTCPRCGLTDVAEPACPRCGVIFAKVREPRPRPGAPRPAAPPSEEPGAGYGSLVLPAVLLAAAAAGAFVWLRRPEAQPVAPAAAPSPSHRIAVEAPQPASLPSPSRPPEPHVPAPAASGMPELDAQAAQALSQRVRNGAPVSQREVDAAESLFARYPDDVTRDLLGAVLMAAASGESGRRRYSEAAALLRRAVGLLAGNPNPRLGLMNVLLTASDWPAAEAAARDALSLDPSNVPALQGLAWALFRQDRNREAAVVLRTVLDIGETAEARALLERIEKAMADEKGMTEQTLAHFHVRYDGDAHEDVGREILRALERHYATLVRTLDFQPAVTIPVILFSRDQYYDASGAPAWSGGAYDGIDGRIRVPIGGLTSSLSADMDDTLVHEVTHAFIAERTAGTAPREVHEGLAQYMEGKRLSALLSPDQLRALADGRAQGVMAFYLRALAFVEYLMAQRGQGGMNDLLRVMGETRDVSEAFRRVYGQDYPATTRAALERLRQQYGS